MKLIIRDIWEYRNREGIICLLVPGIFDVEPSTLMTHPISKEAMNRFPDIEKDVDRANGRSGGYPAKVWGDKRKIFTFPYSEQESYEPCFDIIYDSAKALVRYADITDAKIIAIPKLDFAPELPWEKLYNEFVDMFDDRFHIVQAKRPDPKVEKGRRLYRSRRDRK